MRIEKERLKYFLKWSIVIGVVTMIVSYFYPMLFETSLIIGGAFGLLLTLMTD